MSFLDKIPFWLLILAAIFLGVAPYPGEPQPHVVQKIGMLMDGKLTRLVDIFDLCFHGALMPTLIGIKLYRVWKKQKPGE